MGGGGGGGGLWMEGLGCALWERPVHFLTILKAERVRVILFWEMFVFFAGNSCGEL